MIAFRVDGNKEIGMGHVMRCLAINEELKSEGKDTVFLISPDTDIKEIQLSKTRFEEISSVGEVTEWLEKNKAEILIVDSYLAEFTALNAWNSRVPVLYIDDLNMFQYPVTGILNYNVEATKEKYQSIIKTEKSPILLLGPKYFPARKEFIRKEKYKIRHDVRKVLLTTGSTDPKEIISFLLEKLEVERHREIEFLVIEGLFFNEAYKNKMQEISNQHCNVTILLWGQNMDAIYEQVDLVISPGSTTIFEAFTVGVPCISFSFAENQIPQCNILDAKRMCPYLGDFGDKINRTKSNIQSIFENSLKYHVRIDQYKLYKKEFDGRGAQRIAEQMEKLYESL